MVYLYKNKLPNYGKNTHLFFNDVNDYVTYLGDAFLQFTEDRYTMNGNIAEIKVPSVLDVDNITYIAWNNGGAWRFFFVRSAVYQSGYAIFTLDVDLWATHISHATLSNIRVTRCNRKIETGSKSGLYDPIPATHFTRWEFLGNDLTRDDVSIVFTAVFSTGKSSILFNNAGSYTGVFAVPLKQFPEDYSLKEACEAVGGIYSVQKVLGSEPLTSNEANVTKVFIIPDVALSKFLPMGADAVEFKSQSIKGELLIKNVYRCFPKSYAKEYNINIDPDFQYYVGTKAEGLKIDRTTSAAYFYYEFITKQDGMQILVTQGDKMIDITQAFSVGVTSNNGNLTDYERMSQALNIIGGVASGGFQILTGGAGYVTGALTIANALQSGIVNGNARYIDGGDGLNTFYNTDNSIINNPYVVSKHRSLSDENMRARLYGAIFDTRLNSISEIFNYELLGTGENTDTYVEIDLRVDGVPLEAQTLIETTFATGVYIEQI